MTAIRSGLPALLTLVGLIGRSCQMPKLAALRMLAFNASGHQEESFPSNGSELSFPGGTREPGNNSDIFW